jgi:hypothetical protein
MALPTTGSRSIQYFRQSKKRVKAHLNGLQRRVHSGEVAGESQDTGRDVDGNNDSLNDSIQVGETLWNKLSSK